MPDRPIVPMRRRLIAAFASLGALTTLPGTVLAALIPTPRQSLGPFYPDAIPLDSDNDLVQVEGRPGVAAGEIADLSGCAREQPRLAAQRGARSGGARVADRRLRAGVGKPARPARSGVRDRARLMQPAQGSGWSVEATLAASERKSGGARPCLST